MVLSNLKQFHWVRNFLRTKNLSKKLYFGQKKKLKSVILLSIYFSVIKPAPLGSWKQVFPTSPIVIFINDDEIMLFIFDNEY